MQFKLAIGTLTQGLIYDLSWKFGVLHEVMQSMQAEEFRAVLEVARSKICS
jgi:hypothetical protein